MLGIPFLKFKVIEEMLYTVNYTLLHKKTDTQSYDNRISVQYIADLNNLSRICQQKPVLYKQLSTLLCDDG